MSKDLDRFALLAVLGEDERTELADHLELRQLGRRARLFTEGERADGVWLVVQGRVEVTSARSDAREQLGDGAVLGAFSIVAEGRRETTAETLSPSRLLHLSRASYRALAHAHPRVACRLLEALLVEAAQLLRAQLEEPARPGVDRNPPTD